MPSISTSSFLRRLASGLAVASVGIALAACQSAESYPPLPTVPQVDLARYMGTWYEQAKLPNRFQKQCVANTQARYALADAGVTVENRCTRADGQTDSITGSAKLVPESNNSKLRVSFFKPFYGDYWILQLGTAPDGSYEDVLVGTPSRQYAWILSRSKTIDPARLEALLTYAQSQGFERKAFTRTPQN